VIAKRIGIPYTVALVLGGLLLSVVHLPALAPLHQGHRPDWLTPDVILTLFLPALLFEGSLKIELRHIRTDIVPLLLLANLGVVVGALLGLALGYLVSKLTKRIDDAQVEITLTTILAYGTFLLARHLHLSGVIATVAAGLVIGNFAVKTGMSTRTLTALRSFWEYAAFIINSLVFLLIGLEVRLGDVLRAW